MAQSKCDRCDEHPATTTVTNDSGLVMHLCEWCADQWNEDYADKDEKTETS